MKADPAPPMATPPSPPPDPGGHPRDHACATCGREAVLVLDGTAWCDSCLHVRGSCCAGPETEGG